MSNKKCKLYRIKTARAIVRKFAQMTFGEKLSGSNYGIGTMDANGKIHDITEDEMIDAVTREGLWGFTDTNTGKIYYWADKKSDKRKLIQFFAHEIGHNVGRRYKSVVREELRADEYANVALLAFDMASKI